MNITARNIVYAIVESNTANAKPNRPQKLPKKANNTNKEPILTIAEKPTLVDSLACNFAFKIDVTESGIMDKTKICRLGIPSIYAGKNSSIKNGETTITIREIMMNTKLTFPI